MPKFPDILLNNNPNAPSLDLNNLQVKGVGIFADAAARDALDSNLHTEGYLAIMKDTDTPFIYTGGTWTDTANWQEVKGLWNEDANGINYQAGNVGIGAVSDSTAALTVSGVFNLEDDAVGKSIIIGNGAGASLTATNEAVIIGSDAADVITNAQRLVAIGGQATAASYAVAIGWDVRASSGGVSIGNGAGGAAVAIGNGAGANNANTLNTMIGTSAGNSITSGQANLIVGHDADAAATNSGQTVLGAQAVASGTGAVAIGRLADSTSGIAIGQESKTNSGGVSMGFGSGSSLTTGSNNIFIGPGTGFTTETNNTVVGTGSGGNGVGNVVLGGLNSVKGNTNIIVGYQTNLNLSGATVSGFHTIVGSLITLSATSNFTSTTIIGKNAGKDGSVVRSVLMGESASQGGSATDSTIIGYQAAYNGGTRTNSTIIGHKAAVNSYDSGTSTSASATTIIGTYAGYHSKGVENVYIGRSAGLCYDQGVSVVQTGGNNVAIGTEAGYHLTTSNNNVLIGRAAGYNVTTTSGNVMIGYQAGYNETGGNKLYISNSNTATPLIYGEFDNNIVKINGTYSSGAIGFFPANTNSNDTIAIGDQDYLAAGAGSSAKGLSIMFDSTISAVDYQTGLIIGRNLNIARLKSDQLLIGNRVTSTVAGQAPKIIIGNGIDYTAGNNNHAGAILIGANPACEMGSGVQIGGSGTNFNGVAIQATGAVSSQGGVAIMGEANAYSVIIGASTGAGVSGSSSQKVVIGNGAGESSGIQIAIGSGAGSNKTGDYNTAIGQAAYADNTSTGTGNTIIGKYAGKVLTIASNNTMIGARAALSMTTGSSNVVIGGGLGAGGGSPMQAMTNGSGNIVLGSNALVTATTANYNIIAGLDAGANVGGSNNLILGRRTAFAGTTNDTSITDNVVLGYEAGYNLAGGSNIMIGYQAGYNETGSNKLYIENSNSSSPLIYGEFDNDLLRVNGNLQRVVYGSTETTTSGTIHIRDNTNWATQADATDNTASTGLLGVAQGSQANAGLILFGDVDYTITGNVGDPVYLNTTAGGFTTTAPTASGNIVRVMGYIIGSNKIFFNPSNDWLEIV